MRTHQLTHTPTWHLLTAEVIKVTAASPKALHSTRRALALHEQHSQQECPSKAAYNRAMIAHYRLLATLFSTWQRHAKPSEKDEGGPTEEDFYEAMQWRIT